MSQNHMEWALGSAGTATELSVRRSLEDEGQRGSVVHDGWKRMRPFERNANLISSDASYHPSLT